MLAIWMADNLKKGRRIAIEGRLENRRFTDKNGVLKEGVEIVCESITPADGKIERGSRKESEEAEAA
jgi:single-stranded DNA-binding protein